MHVAHVLGLAHSGTTIIDRIFSCFPGVIGLGEIEQMWPKARNGTADRANCPCGRKPSACPFWSEVLARPPTTVENFFRTTVETATRHGHGWLIDTSKAMSGTVVYGKMVTAGEIDDLLIVRVIRDPRAWVHSMMLRNQIDASDIDRVRLLFHRWLISSLLLDRRVLLPDAERIYVWYDRLLLTREEKALAPLVGLPVPKGELALNDANQHAVAGNKFVFSERRASLSYDVRWMQSAVVEDVYAEMPALRAYYREVQTLHMNRGALLRGVPKADVLRKHLKTLAGGAALPSTFEALQRNLTVSADLHAVPSSAGKAVAGRPDLS